MGIKILHYGFLFRSGGWVLMVGCQVVGGRKIVTCGVCGCGVGENDVSSGVVGQGSFCVGGWKVYSGGVKGGLVEKLSGKEDLWLCQGR